MHGRPRSQRRGPRAAIGAVVLLALVATGVATVAPAGAAPSAPAPKAAPSGPAVVAAAPPPIAVLPPVDPGPDGTVPITRVASPATQTIAPLGPVDPGPDGSVTINQAPVVLNPPVEPAPLTLPLVPAQTLIDAAEANALATLGAAVPSFLGPGGTPDLDPAKLQPQVGAAPLLPTPQPTLAQVVEALLQGQIPPPLPIDVLALLQGLPHGVPRITYRICSESATKPVSCSLTLPLAVPALVDVTGDGTVDVLADLLPAVSVDSILAAVQEVLDLQGLLAAAQNTLASVLALLQNPLALLFNPFLLIQALQLQQLVAALTADLADAVEALVSLVNIGLGLLVLRMPTSETTGGPLPAHVWAVYQLPDTNHSQLSIGYDGLRRGTTLPNGTLGIFTFDVLGAAQGVFDVHASLRQGGAGSSMAVTAGIAKVTQDAASVAFDPTVVSAQFSPVPSVFTAHAVVDLAEEEGSIDTTSDRPSRLDAIVVTRRGGPVAPFGRFTQLVVDQLPTSLSAELTRPPTGGAVSLQYRASAPIASLRLSDFEYSGITLQRALAATATGIPTAIDATLTSAQQQSIDISLDYAASARTTGVDVGIFDRPAANLVATASLQDIPSELSLLVDLPDDHVLFEGNGRLGSAQAVASRNLGSFAPLAGDHTTLVVAGAGLGASAQVTGLLSVDAFFGSHPRATARFEPGGQPFVAAGDIDGIFKVRLDISNLPSFVSADLDPAAGTLGYDASSVISQVRAAFIKTDTGPSLLATVFDLPISLDASWVLGESTELTYDASSVIPRIEFFASPQPIEILQPLVHHYLSVAVVDVPTEVALTLDFAARHVEGVMSAPLGGVLGVARFPFAGDVYAAAVDLQGVPAHFDADFHDGFYRFQGITGPIAVARLSITNHAGTTAPTGQHLAVGFRETTGDFDASVFVLNLSHIEYSRGTGAQTFRLDVDTAGEPLFVDVDVLLAAGGVDDTRLAAFARIDGLPTTMSIRLSDGELIYTANSPVSILAELRVGKVAALNGLGAPIFAHGVAVAAKGCAPGPGCATDATPFCTIFSSCVGVVATANLPGLPTEIAVDLDSREIAITAWNPPPAVPFQAYVRLLGLVPTVPELEALVAIDGLPSPLDITIGPISLEGAGNLDVAYTASAAIGSLEVLLEAHDTAAFGTLRGRATASPLPATLHIAAQFGSLTTVSIDNSAPIDAITATITGDAASDPGLDASITGIPAQVDFELDLNTRHAEWDASGTLGGIEVLARVPFGGRTWGAYALLAGVPDQWDADFDFDNGTVRFRGLNGGELAAAQLAITNHSAATVPTGQHLAAHFRETTENLDAGVRVTDLSHVELVRTTSQSTFRLDSGGELVTIDAEAILEAGGTDDTVFAVVARLDTPNTFRVTLGDGQVTYRADTPVALLASARIGKVAALTGLGAPLFANGIGARARGCDAGDPGCFTPDPTLVCSFFNRCGGIVANINLPGLPTEVVVDLEEKHLTIDGYEPPAGNELELFVQLDDLLDTIPHAAALVTLGGLPFALDLTVGPFNFVDGDVTEFEVGYTGSDSIGSLEVEAEADTTTTFGDLRGRAFLSRVPASATVSGEFGSLSEIHVDMSDPVDILSLQVTGLLQGNPASGLVAFTSVVPAHMDLTVKGFAEQALGVPTITYNGFGDSRLDGLIQIEADLIEAFSTGGVTIPVAGDAYAQITDLGANTTVVINPDKSVVFTSSPVTGSIALGATIESKVDPSIPLNLQVFDEFGFTGTLVGHVGAPKIHIGDFELSITQLVSLVLSPSNVTYLTTGITGNYNTLSIDIADVSIIPDVELTLKVDGPAFFDFNIGPIVINDEFTGIRFHVADQVLRESDCLAFSFGPVDVVHARIFTKPGKIATGLNSITVSGANGPQALNYIDPVPTPLGIDPALVSIGIDLLTVYVTDPFNDSEADYDVDFGGC